MRSKWERPLINIRIKTVLLPTCRCCLPYGLPGGHRIISEKRCCRYSSEDNVRNSGSIGVQCFAKTVSHMLAAFNIVCTNLWYIYICTQSEKFVHAHICRFYLFLPGDDVSAFTTFAIINLYCHYEYLPSFMPKSSCHYSFRLKNIFRRTSTVDRLRDD